MKASAAHLVAMVTKLLLKTIFFVSSHIKLIFGT